MSYTIFAMLLAATLAGSGTSNGNAQTAIDRAERDELFYVPDDDPQMAIAMRKARATLPEFLALARAAKPPTEGFSVKIGIRDGSGAEYFWIFPFEEKNGRVTGKINNTPRSTRKVKMGQAIEFTHGEIVDWLYFEDGKMKGNYTACALLKREPKQQAEAFKQRFGLECDG
jgi:uncharacterized protein YegJ (DUF2314 family)